MASIDERVVELKFNTSDFERGVRTTKDGLSELNNTLNSGAMAKGIDNVSSKFNAFGAIAFSGLQRATNAAIDAGVRIGNALIGPLVDGGRKRAMNIEQAKFQFRGLGMDVEQSMDDALYAVKGTAFGLDEAAVAASMFGASGIESGEQMKTALRGISGVAAMAGSSYSDMANVFTKVAGQGRVMSDDLNRLSARGMNAAATIADYMNEVGGFGEQTEATVREMVTKGEIDFELFSTAMSEAFGEHATKASDTFTGALSNVNAALARIGEMYWAPALERSRQLFNTITPVIDGIATAVEPVIKGFSRMADISFDNLNSFIRGLGFADASDDFTPPIIDGLRTIGSIILGFARPIFDAWQKVFPPMALENVRNIGTAVQDFANSIRPSAEMLQNWGNTFKGLFAIFGIAWELIKALTAGIFEFIGALMPAGSGILGVTGSLGELIYSLYDAIRSGDGLTTFFKGLGSVLAAPIRFIIDIVSALFGIGEASAGVIATGIGAFFSKLGEIVRGASEAFQNAGGTLRGAFGAAIEYVGDAIEKVLPIFGKIRDFLEPLTNFIGEMASSIGGGLKNMFENLDFGTVLKGINTGVLAFLGISIGKFFKSFTASEDSMIGQALKSVTGFFDTLKGAKDAAKDSSGAIKQIFEALTPSLEALQNNIKADTLIKIATAIGILALAVIGLSMVEPAKLVSSLTAITVMFAQMMGALSIFTKIVGDKSVLKLPIVAAGLMLLAGAIALLSVSVLMLSGLDWNGLAKGLVGVGVLLASIAGFLHIIPDGGKGLIGTGIGMIAIAGAIALLSISVRAFAEMSWGDLAKGMAGVAAGLLIIAGAVHLMPSSGMVRAGIGLIAISTGLLILSSALSNFADMSWGEMGSGMVALAGALVIIAGAMNLMPKNLIVTAAGLVIFGFAIKNIASALNTFGNMEWESIGRGLVGLAGSLILIAIAMNLMPANLILTAAGLVVVAYALEKIADVMGTFGGMSWEEIGKGMVVLAGSLLILAGGLYLMTGAIVGAAALVVVAAALTIFVPVLQTLGNMSWGAILSGLGALALSFLVLGVAGIALAAVTPILLALGGAIILMGVGAMAAGIGLVAVAAGLTAIVALGSGGLAVLNEALKMLIGLIPQIISSIATGLVDALGVLADSAVEIMGHIETLILGFLEVVGNIIPEIVSLGVDILLALIEGIMEVAPELMEAGKELFLLLLEGIQEVIPEIVDTVILIIEEFTRAIVELAPTLGGAGLEFLNGFLEGFSENLDPLIETVGELIVNFITALEEQVDDIIAAGVSFIVTFLEGVGGAVEEISTTATQVVVDLINALSDNSEDIRIAGTDALETFIDGFGDSGTTIINQAGTTITELVEALGENGYKIVTAGGQAVVRFIEGIGEQTVNIIAAGTKIIVDVLTGLTRAIPQIIPAAVNLIVVFVRTIGAQSRVIADAAFKAIIDFVDGITDAVERNSGELRRAGKDLAFAIADGMTGGLASKVGEVAAKAKEMASSALGAAKRFLGVASPSRAFMEIGENIGEGMIIGIDSMGRSVYASSEGVAVGAVEGMRRGLSDIDALLDSDMDMNPVITPVLDLTEIRAQSEDLEAIFGNRDVSLGDESYYRASEIARLDRQNRTSHLVPDTSKEEAQVLNFNYTQNNTSPKALSELEIYRQTKNQISTVKEALDRNAHTR